MLARALVFATTATSGSARGADPPTCLLAARCRSFAESGEIPVAARKGGMDVDDLNQLSCIRPAMEASANEEPSLMLLGDPCDSAEATGDFRFTRIARMSICPTAWRSPPLPPRSSGSCQRHDTHA